MSRLYTQVKKIEVLERAWKQVRANAITSKSPATKEALATFEEDATSNLRKIQYALSRHTFKFEKQRGVAIEKKKGSGKHRPLVIAPIQNRIVQRALLDVLVEKVGSIRQVMDTPTSVGGIPRKGTRHGIKLICDAIDQGARFFVRSDIEGFFTKIPKSQIIEFVAKAHDDASFSSLFAEALETELENADKLKEHLDLFPIGDTGVAQGSALSTLAGNILLRQFDQQLNRSGIVCVRYIDDFILLGPSESKLQKAFSAAQKTLSGFSMNAYSPYENSDKAERGEVTAGFDFLGCHISSKGKIVEPSKKARTALLERIQDALNDGEMFLLGELDKPIKNRKPKAFAQTMTKVSGIAAGWGHAFSFCNNALTLKNLDRDIDSLISKYRNRVRQILKGADQDTKRRILGVQLLVDIPHDQFIEAWALK